MMRHCEPMLIPSNVADGLAGIIHENMGRNKQPKPLPE